MTGQSSGDTRRSQQQSSSDNSPSYNTTMVLSQSSMFSSRPTTASISGPSTLEAQNYYFGLSGNPTLLARSSDDVFSLEYSNNYQVKKRIFPVTEHAIINIFDHGPRDQIHAALEGCITWRAIDIIRLGTSQQPMECPVVVLIRVEQDTVPARNALEAVRRCRVVLVNVGLDDVHAEILAMKKPPQIFTNERPTNGKQVPNIPYERIPRIGRSFGCHSGGLDHSSGTLGLYLTLRRPNQTTRVGLSYHHVAFTPGVRDPPAGRNNAYTYTSNDKTVFGMDSPSYSDHCATVQYHERLVDNFDSYLKSFLDLQDRASRDEGPYLSQGQIATMESYQHHKEQGMEKLKLLDESKIYFGNVLATSGMSIDPHNGHGIDWAVVFLCPKRFNQYPQNRLPEVTLSQEHVNSMNDKLPPEHHFKPLEFPEIVTDYVPINEIFNTSIRDTNNEPTFRVIKYGRTTGWTAGESNGLRSSCQRSNGTTTKEWLILDQNIAGAGHFSGRGDSGAAILDYKGRVVGILYAGGNQPLEEGGQEMAGFTYATPFTTVAESIARAFNCTVRL